MAYVLWIIILIYCFYYVVDYHSLSPIALIQFILFRPEFKISFFPPFWPILATEWYFNLSIYHSTYSSKPDCILLQKKDVFNTTLPRRWLLICLWRVAILLRYHWGLEKWDLNCLWYWAKAKWFLCNLKIWSEVISMPFAHFKKKLWVKKWSLETAKECNYHYGKCYP